MALDGVFLKHIKNELEQRLIDSKVDKIYMPTRDSFVLSMRSREGTDLLLISARANSPRINLTNIKPENPKVPPMLCMLMRKRLTGARLRSVDQPGLERLLMLNFEGRNELGDTVMLTLSVEIMGQYSNIVFIDENNVIIDAVKRVDASMSSRRLVLPGMKYELPPQQSKLSMLEYEAEDIIKAVEKIPGSKRLDKALLSVIQGVSPIICRELEYLTGRGADVYSDSLDEERRTRLSYFLKRDIALVRDMKGEPFIITDNTGKPVDFTYEYIQQYGSGRAKKEADTFSALLDLYYSKKDNAETIRSKAEDLTKLMNNCASRLIKKIYIQTDELKNCADREQLRICGDLIQANLYRIKRGAAEFEAENFYDENMSMIKIKLDPALSAATNAQRYYKNYQKAKTAEQVLKVQIEKAESELDYVSSVLDAISRAETVRELGEIRQELTEQGYLRSSGKKQKADKPLPPKEYISNSGFRILTGRNNKQNDRLTLKQADKNDIWFHAKDIPGSHTIIVTGGRKPDDDTMLMAARIAAFNSKAGQAGKVPVDHTLVRYVSKPQGAKPGMVIYINQKTMYVEPENYDECDKQGF